MYAKLDDDKNIIDTGDLFKLHPKCTNPALLSEDELKENNLYLIELQPQSLNTWEVVGEQIYTYDSDLDKVTSEYTSEEISLDKFKELKINEIKATYNQILTEGFTTTSGIKVDCERDNVTDFTNGYQNILLEGKNGTAVIDYDNNTHNLSLEDYVTLLKELGTYYKTQLFNKQKLKQLVNFAISYEQVNDIYWRVWVEDNETLEGHWEYSDLVD